MDIWMRSMPVAVSGVVFYTAMLGLPAGEAGAEILRIEGESYIEFNGFGLPGWDSFPLNELYGHDPVSFVFEFDTSAAVVWETGGVASYEYSGLEAWVQIGSHEVNFESLSLWAGTNEGAGIIMFTATNEELGIFARLSFQGTTPVLTTPPTSLDLDLFDWGSLFEVDTLIDPFHPHMLSGPIFRAEIVPASGTVVCLLGGAVVCGWRRRR